MKRFLCVVGTRPEAIKMAPVILELSAHAQVTTLCSGQHTKLAEEPLKWFGITPDDTIKVAKSRTLATLTAALLPAMERMIAKHQPDVVVAQGDTTTVLVAALTAFYTDIPFAHVEAGLRTRNLRAPFPEEFNRVAADRLARWHFCPTARRGRQSARRGDRSGAVHHHRQYRHRRAAARARAASAGAIRHPNPPPLAGEGRERARHAPHPPHRAPARESGPAHGGDLPRHCRAGADFDDIEFAIPVHPNPEVRATFERLRVAHQRVQLMPPLSYPRLVAEMARAHLIVTDSGGIQEEAPFLKKPVLVMRDVTERPEAVELGVARLIGAETASIVGAVRELLTDADAYARMAAGGSPYGDGYAAARISAVFGFGQRRRVPQRARRDDKIGIGAALFPYQSRDHSVTDRRHLHEDRLFRAGAAPRCRRRGLSVPRHAIAGDQCARRRRTLVAVAAQARRRGAIARLRHGRHLCVGVRRTGNAGRDRCRCGARLALLWARRRVAHDHHVACDRPLLALVGLVGVSFVVWYWQFDAAGRSVGWQIAILAAIVVAGRLLYSGSCRR